MAKFKCAVSALICGVTQLLAQQATLRITSPRSQAIVHTGESLSVVIQGSGAELDKVALIPPAPIPIPTPDVLRKPPFTFTLRIPEDMEPGLHQLVARGLTVSQQHVTSNQVWIDIERPDQPVSIRLDPEGPYELRPGLPLVIDVYGIYKNGAKVLLNESTETSFVSEDPNVMGIQLYGVLHGIENGSTNLVIRVNDKIIKQRVTVRRDE